MKRWSSSQKPVVQTNTFTARNGLVIRALVTIGMVSHNGPKPQIWFIVAVHCRMLLWEMTHGSAIRTNLDREADDSPKGSVVYAVTTNFSNGYFRNHEAMPGVSGSCSVNSEVCLPAHPDRTWLPKDRNAIDSADQCADTGKRGNIGGVFWYAIRNLCNGAMKNS